MKRMTKIGIYGMAVWMLSACGNGTPDYDATGTFEATEVIVSAEAAGKLLQKNGGAVNIRRYPEWIKSMTSEKQNGKCRRYGKRKGFTDTGTAGRKRCFPLTHRRLR